MKSYDKVDPAKLAELAPQMYAVCILLYEGNIGDPGDEASWELTSQASKSAYDVLQKLGVLD